MILLGEHEVQITIRRPASEDRGNVTASLIEALLRAGFRVTEKNDKFAANVEMIRAERVR